MELRSKSKENTRLHQLQQKQTKMVTKKYKFFYSKQSKLHTSNNKK